MKNISFAVFIFFVNSIKANTPKYGKKPKSSIEYAKFFFV